MRSFDPENYVDVQARINRFWEEHPWPAGSIETQMMSHPTEWERVVFKATVSVDGKPLATGWAAEEKGASTRDGANFTNWHENAETSAIGRALANLGYAKNREERPSREEMEKAARMQAAYQPLPPSPAIVTGAQGDRTRRPQFNRPNVEIDRPVGGPGVPLASDVPPHNGISFKQWKFFNDVAAQAGFTQLGILQQMASNFGLASVSWSHVTSKMISDAIDWLKGGQQITLRAWLDAKYGRKPDGAGQSPNGAAIAAEAIQRDRMERMVERVSETADSALLNQLYDEAEREGYFDERGGDGLTQAFERAVTRIEQLQVTH